VKSTSDDIENKAEWCQNAVGKVIDAAAQKIRICA
jgi:hypothetical protein